jgi:stage III sporulation protein AD
MAIYKIIGIGVITAISVLIVKQVKPEIAIIVGLAGSIIILLNIISMLSDVLQTFSTIVDKTGISKDVFTTILKIIGIGYLTEFSSNLCIDIGSTSIAEKILLAGKVIILVIALPIVSSLINTISGILV